MSSILAKEKNVTFNFHDCYAIFRFWAQTAAGATALFQVVSLNLCKRKKGTQQHDITERDPVKAQTMGKPCGKHDGNMRFRLVWCVNVRKVTISSWRHTDHSFGVFSGS